MTSLQERLDRNEVIILDGAMGTELQRRGVPMDRVAWSGAALNTHPNVREEIHEDYIRARADVITTNTFAACRHTLEAAGMSDLVGEMNPRAVALARQALCAAGEGREVSIAGSITTFKPSLKPNVTVTSKQAKTNYTEQAHILAESSVDLIMMEMMQDVEQSAYAIESALSTGLPVWVGFSCKFDDNGAGVTLLDGQSEAFADSLKRLLPLGGLLVSVMHTTVPVTTPALRAVSEKWSGPKGSYPHSGVYEGPDWRFVDIVSPRDFLQEATNWTVMGVQVIGSCCGLGPEHIRVLKEGLPSHVGKPA